MKILMILALVLTSACATGFGLAFETDDRYADSVKSGEVKRDVTGDTSDGVSTDTTLTTTFTPVKESSRWSLLLNTPEGIAKISNAGAVRDVARKGDPAVSTNDGANIATNDAAVGGGLYGSAYGGGGTSRRKAMLQANAARTLQLQQQQPFVLPTSRMASQKEVEVVKEDVGKLKKGIKVIAKQVEELTPETSATPPAPAPPPAPVTSTPPDKPSGKQPGVPETID